MKTDSCPKTMIKWFLFLVESLVPCMNKVHAYYLLHSRLPPMPEDHHIYEQMCNCCRILILPMLPIMTWVVCVRLEEVNLRRLGTIAKSLGTIVSISGAFIITLYSGPAILNKPLTSGPLTQFYFSSTQNWVLGGFLLACAAFAVASWCILQV